MNENRLWGTVEYQQKNSEMRARTAWMVAVGPLGWVPPWWQQQLYQAAYERAVAVNRPWPPRALALPCLN
jgi:hypothetical protein